MVRLGGFVTVSCAKEKLVSIPAWCDWEPAGQTKVIDCLTSFNSSMVRLGDYLSSPEPGKLRCFNSSMVRLGVNMIDVSRRVRLRFNSSMVRLGVRDIRGDRITNNVSIPAWCDWELEASFTYWRRGLVSIPAWCDWEQGSNIITTVSLLVSIPAWCDWERTGSAATGDRSGVSIPAWCDWEGMCQG